MRTTKPTITEKILLNGQKTVMINAEIPEDLWNSIMKAHDQEVNAGRSSLTIEQFSGSFVQMGYNWMLYNGLKSVFGK